MKKNRIQNILNYIFGSLIFILFVDLVLDDTNQEINELYQEVYQLKYLEKDAKIKDSLILDLQDRANSLVLICKELEEQSPGWEKRINYIKSINND